MTGDGVTSCEVGIGACIPSDTQLGSDLKRSVAAGEADKVATTETVVLLGSRARCSGVSAGVLYVNGPVSSSAMSSSRPSA